MTDPKKATDKALRELDEVRAQLMADAAADRISDFEGEVIALPPPPDDDDDLTAAAFHLPGQHNQKEHGKGGGGKPSGDSPPAKKAAPKKAAPKKAAPSGGGGGGPAGDADSGTIGGQMDAMPKIDDPSDISAVARSANPKYLQGGAFQGEVTDEMIAQGGPSYAHNCTRVAIAYEMRRRGVDATAGAGATHGDSPAAYTRSFRTKDGKYAVRMETDLDRSMSVSEVTAEVKGWPVGARGIVTMDGHTLNVERTATGVRFVDAQSGSRKNPVLTPGQFEARAAGRGARTDAGMAVTRTDDLDMSDYSLHYVEGSGLDVGASIVTKTRYPDTPDMHLPSDQDLLDMVPDDSYP